MFLQSYDRLRPRLLPHTDSSGRSKSRSGSSHNISSHIAFSDTCNRVDSSVWRAYPTPHAAQTRADCAGSEPASLPRVLSDAPARHAPLQPHTGLFLQLTQLQPLQNTSDAKHSQYSFKHRDFRQLHVCFYPQKGETGKPNEWDREKIRQSWTLQVRAAAHAQATPLSLQTPITATESRGFRRGTRLVLQEKTLYLRHGSRDRPRASASTGPRSAPRRLFLLRCCRPA